MNNSTENYYTDRTRISNSNIGWFLNKGPAFLYKMLTEDVPEEKNPVLERGTMIHEYLLQPEEFQKDYVIWDKVKPFSAQQEKFCQELANTIEIEPDKAILNAYKKAYSTRGKTDDKMLSEGQEIASTLKDYIDFLKENDGRIMITPSECRMLEKIKQNVQSHKLAWKLINPDGRYGSYSYDTMPEYFKEDPTRASKYENLTWHEFHINWTYYVKMAAGVECKSLLDSLTLDFKNKKATIMDLKTTAKLWHFEESIDTYDYLRQLCYYYQAVVWYLKYELKEDSNKWNFEFYIIGIDTTGTNEIRVFKIDQFKVYSRKDTILNAMQDIMWHQERNLWDHSRAYYEGDGSETLDL